MGSVGYQEGRYLTAVWLHIGPIDQCQAPTRRSMQRSGCGKFESALNITNECLSLRCIPLHTHKLMMTYMTQFQYHCLQLITTSVWHQLLGDKVYGWGGMQALCQPWNKATGRNRSYQKWRRVVPRLILEWYMDKLAAAAVAHAQMRQCGSNYTLIKHWTGSCIVQWLVQQLLVPQLLWVVPHYAS